MDEWINLDEWILLLVAIIKQYYIKQNVVTDINKLYGIAKLTEKCSTAISFNIFIRRMIVIINIDILK